MSIDPRSTRETHKEIIRRLFQEAWTNADFNKVHELLAPQITFHFRGQAHIQTAENLIQIVERWKAAFPDLRFTVEEIIAEDNMAAARLVYQGTQQAEWKGILATGRNITVHEMMFFRFEAGRILEVWEVADEYSLRQQLMGNND